MAALFHPEPAQWGLRGDPHLWQALRDHLASTAVPASEAELIAILHDAIRELAEIDLASDNASSAYREQYARGGMSSGMISLDTWRQRLIPLLAQRASVLRQQG